MSLSPFVRLNDTWFKCSWKRKKSFTDPPDVPNMLVAVEPANQTEVQSWLKRCSQRKQVLSSSLDLAIYWAAAVVDEDYWLQPFVQEDGLATEAHEHHLLRNSIRRKIGLPLLACPAAIRRNLVIPRQDDRTTPPFWNNNDQCVNRYLAALKAVAEWAQVTVPLYEPSLTLRKLTWQERGEAIRAVLPQLVPPGTSNGAAEFIAALWLDLEYGHDEAHHACNNMTIDTGAFTADLYKKKSGGWGTLAEELPGFMPADKQSLKSQHFIRWQTSCYSGVPSGDVMTIDAILPKWPGREPYTHPQLPGFMALVRQPHLDSPILLWGPPEKITVAVQ